MARFEYEAAVIEAFPTVVGGVVRGTNVPNGRSPEPLVEAFRTEQAAVLERIGETPLSELPSLAAWRRVFRGFGVDPTAYRSAAEALLRRLTKQGSIPSVSALVDIGNLVSVRHQLPVAVFDLSHLEGGLTVRRAEGTESFTELGSGERQTPDAGEVIFLDGADQVCARRWCWRQSLESASSSTTTDVLITVEGHHGAAADDVSAAVEDLLALLDTYAPSPTTANGIVTAASPVWSDKA
jgi:DNA/RNA-binding domain of Phe-tRNA-synthetase-like protein